MVSLSKADTEAFDVFLSYNSRDHEVVTDVACRLREAKLVPYLDRWYLVGGQRWLPALEKSLTRCRAVAVFIGPHGLGSWQHREVDSALIRQASGDEGFPVIPILLPGCEPPLGFLKQLNWIDLRSGPLEAGLLFLQKSINREPVGGDLKEQLAATRATVCPYRGLLPFREEDASFFFGREAAVKQLVEAASTTSFLVVVGASGSGKSSVVRAGLVPQLRRSRDRLWEIATMVPGDRPLQRLANALLPLLEPAMSEVKRLVEAGTLAEAFLASDVALVNAVERVLEKQSGTERLLLIVDQWEELYTLTSEPERRRFLDLVLDATKRAPLTVVATLRGDFVGHALTYRPLSDRLQNAQINLGPMLPEELARAVREPLEQVGLGFEEGLEQRLLNDVGNEPGNLPLLEFVLRQLWEERERGLLRHEKYDAIGGLRGAISSKANQFYSRLSEPEQEAVRRIFLEVLRADPTGEYTRRRERLDNIPTSSWALVRKLADERLIVTSRLSAEAGETFEVAHEALVQGWDSLGTWLNADREFLLWRERFRGLLEVWTRGQRNDDDLPRGPTLDEAERWYEKRADRLTASEHEFLSLSKVARERRRAAEKQRQEEEAAAKEALLQLEKEKREQAEQGQRSSEQASARARRITRFATGFAVATILLGLEGCYLFWRSKVSADLAKVEGREADYQAEERHLMSVATAAQAAEAEKAVFEDFFQGDKATAVGKASGTFASIDRALCYRSKNGAASKVLGYWATSNDLRFFMGSLVQEPIKTASFGPDRRQLVIVTRGETARAWEMERRPAAGAPLRVEDEVTVADFSPDRRWIVTFRRGTIARIWDAESGLPISAPLRHEDEVTWASFSSDGRRVVTTSWDRTVRVWDAQSGRLAGPPLHHEKRVMCVNFSPDGRRLVTGSQDGAARVWDVESGLQVGPPLRHMRGITSARFSPDGKRVATASWDNTAGIWDVKSGQPVCTPLHHEQEVMCVNFSPDGSRVVTSSWDKTARVWEVEGGTEVISFRHSYSPDSAIFSSDGRRVVTVIHDFATYNYRALIWDLESGQLVGRHRDNSVNSKMQLARAEREGQLEADAIHQLEASSLIAVYVNKRRQYDASLCRLATKLLLDQTSVTQARMALNRAAELDPGNPELLELRARLPTP